LLAVLQSDACSVQQTFCGVFPTIGGLIPFDFFREQSNAWCRPEPLMAEEFAKQVVAQFTGETARR
jgi:hypothetical protein